MFKKITVKNILHKKRINQKITMLTAYDYPMASLVDQSGVDIVLVGDSLANVVLGLNSTRDVGMTELIHHARAVRRGVKRALLIGDMPYRSYRTRVEAVKNAKRFIREAGCDGVKFEWFKGCDQVAQDIVRAGIAVMGHVGLTPQTAKKFKVQAVTAKDAKRIAESAKDLENAGCFSIVLECIPDQVAAIITKQLKIPTIGIGAGIHCDGQVLVTHDLLGLFTRFHPRFVKQYADLSEDISAALTQYVSEVKKRRFPTRRYSFSMDTAELNKLKETV